MVGFIVYMVVIGIVAGFLARLLVPGRDPIGFFATMVLGIVGSFIGGFLGYVLFGKDLNEGAVTSLGPHRLRDRRSHRAPWCTERSPAHTAMAYPPVARTFSRRRCPAFGRGFVVLRALQFAAP